MAAHNSPTPHPPQAEDLGKPTNLQGSERTGGRYKVRSTSNRARTPRPSQPPTILF